MMKKMDIKKGAHKVRHNPGYDFRRLVCWMNENNSKSANIHIAPYFIPTIALIGACFSLEGYINMIGQHIDKGWNDFDKGRVTVKDKLKRIYKKLNKPFNCSDGIWQEVLVFFKKRGSLVHSKYVNKTEVRVEIDKIHTIFQDIRLEYPPRKSKEILEKAIGVLLTDAKLCKLKDHWQDYSYEE